MEYIGRIIKMTDWRKNAIVIIFAAILLGVMSWAFYRIIYQGSSDLLQRFGVLNTYWQNGLVILIAIFLLIILGVTGKEVLKKITG